MKTRNKGYIISLLLLLMLVFGIHSVKAITYEGDIGVGAGGLTSYVAWFENHAGVLIVTTNFANNSGIDYADVTIIAVCIDEEKEFRLRVYDSDEEVYINSDKEKGVGVKERRFSIQPHRDRNNLTWIASAVSDDGLVTFAELTLKYTYDPDMTYNPVIDEQDYPGWPAEKRRLIIRAWAWGIQVLVGSLAAIVLAVRLANRFWGAG